MATPLPLPKAGSGAFKQLLAQVGEVLDLPRLCLVLEGALDRKSLEEILRKVLQGGHVRPGAMPRGRLVAGVADAWGASGRASFLTMRALDKCCRKERHIVGSMDEDTLDVRLSSYRALDFRRERARLIWALVRDGRTAHRIAADRILTDAFEQLENPVVAEEPKASAAPEELGEKVQLYEEAIAEAGEMLQKAQSEAESAETEHAALVTKLGVRERALKEEQRRRATAEDEAKRLRRDVKKLQAALDELDPERLQDALQERDKLRERARSLERQADRAERVSDLEEQLATLEAENAELRADTETRKQEHAELLRQLVSRERAALDRVSSLRGSLKTARQLASAPADPSVAEGDPVTERVGVFVDAENLAASARRNHGGRFDFRAMLGELVGERKQVTAVAYVVEPVDNDGAFSGFVRSLMAGGFEVRQKKARRRKDGTVKADWDMGIAMEIIGLRSRLDVVVLCSGDGDFVPLVHRMKKWGKRVEVAAFSASTQESLARAADEFTVLDGARFRIST